MSSQAFEDWRTVGLARLAELEAVHAELTGSGPGRRWGTTQLNRALFLALVAQFQSYCRDLHDEAAEVHVDAATAGHRDLVKLLMLQGRQLQTRNPRCSTLGSDFQRLGVRLIDDLKASGPATAQRLVALDLLVDYRNAIGHGDEAKIKAFENDGRIRATKRLYQQHRRTLECLAATMDSAVADGLARVLGIRAPW
jgi:hypothetical protein